MLYARSRVLAVVAVLASGVLPVACTSGGGPTTSSTAPSTAPERTATGPAGPSSVPTPAAPTTPPTTAVTASSCPFAALDFVHDTVGLRLGRVTRLMSGGTVVGCRIYALQGGSLHASEHLPGPDQPAVEITTRRYADPTGAHNAFVLRAEAGTGPQQVTFGAATGLCFQNRFDPQDEGSDFACTVNKGSTLVVVRTVDTTGYFNTAHLLTAVLRAV